MGTGNLQHAICKLLHLSNDRAQTGTAQVVFPKSRCELAKDSVPRSSGTTAASPTPQLLPPVPSQAAQPSLPWCHPRRTFYDPVHRKGKQFWAPKIAVWGSDCPPAWLIILTTWWMMASELGWQGTNSSGISWRHSRAGLAARTPASLICVGSQIGWSRKRQKEKNSQSGKL